MLLNSELVAKLIPILKQHAPVRTGNLRDNGVQGIVNVKPGLYLVQIGYPATGGYVATESYAKYTHLKNRTSKGWVTRAINEWFSKYNDEIKQYAESSGSTNEL